MAAACGGNGGNTDETPCWKEFPLAVADDEKCGKGGDVNEFVTIARGLEGLTFKV